MTPDRQPETPRAMGPRAVLPVVYATSAASIYFALGLVAKQALGLTPAVFLVGGLFLGLAAMSYAQATLGQRETGGSSLIAGMAFNELVSFAAGWAVVLDFVVIIAISAVSAAGYLATIWKPLGDSGVEVLAAGLVIFWVAQGTIRGSGRIRMRMRAIVAFADVGVQVVLLLIGLALVMDPGAAIGTVDLGVTPKWTGVIYALTLVTVAFSGLEAASSLAPEISIAKRHVGRFLGGGVLLIILLQTGIAMIGISALPVTGGQTALGGQWLKAPLVGVAKNIDPGGIGPALGVVVAISGFLALTAAASSAMFAVSRLAYALTRHRQVPRVVGRLSDRYGTPWLIIVGVAAAAFALAAPTDIAMLAGIYAFGAMLAITVVHIAVVRMSLSSKFPAPTWRMPLSVPVGSRYLPIPAIAGAIASASAFGVVLWLHPVARWVGGGWLMAGIALYLIYRALLGNSPFTRVEVPDRALHYSSEPAQYGAMLVPIFGEALDDEIIQTAGRLAGGNDPSLESEGVNIEAIWFHEIPLSLPIDAPLSDEQSATASASLRRAKAVGEEYEGVTVSTAQVRVRRIGEGIVSEAKRRGSEAIVVAAEPSSSLRGGASLGGRSNLAGSSVGEITKFVLRKAHCRVILTFPALEADLGDRTAE